MMSRLWQPTLLHLGHIILIACCKRQVQSWRVGNLSKLCLHLLLLQCLANFSRARKFTAHPFFSTHNDKKTLEGGKTFYGLRQEAENQMKVAGQRLSGSLKHFKLPNVKDCVYAALSAVQYTLNVKFTHIWKENVINRISWLNFVIIIC